jgi:hypothetical protein
MGATATGEILVPGKDPRHQRDIFFSAGFIGTDAAAFSARRRSLADHDRSAGSAPVAIHH